VEKSKEINSRLKGLRKQGLQGVKIPGEGHLATYYKEDPRDDYYETKKAVVEDSDHLGLGTDVPVTAKDLQYLQDQKTKEEKFLYDSWKFDTFKPGSDPVKLKYYEKLDPSFFKDREDEIDKVLDFVLKLAMIVLHGPRDEEDVMMIYGLTTGRIPIPDWRAVFPEDRSMFGTTEGFGASGLLADNQIKRGYWNPSKFAPANVSQHVPSLYTPGAVLRPYQTGTKDLLTGNVLVSRWKAAAGRT
jgi:hypothetical protein